MERNPKFNFEHRRKHQAFVQMEWISKRYTDSTVEASRALLKAQLLAGQHTLNKERFVNISKQHGWILQIPQQLLLWRKRAGLHCAARLFLCVMKKTLLFIIYRVYRMRTNQGPCPAKQGCKMTKITKVQLFLALMWLGLVVYAFLSERPEWSWLNQRKQPHWARLTV